MGEIDLPAPAAPKADLPAARPAAPARPAAKAFGEVELPAVKAPAPPRPVSKATAPGFDDLPSVAGRPGADLPATKPKAPAATKMEFGEIDLPSVGGTRDLPAVAGPRDLPAVPTMGSRDLPAVPTVGSRDLPSPRTQNFGELDLPSVSAMGGHLPAVRAPGADLPDLAPAGAHLPAIAGPGANLPAVAHPGANLPSVSAHQGNLPSARDIGHDPFARDLGVAQTMAGPGYQPSNAGGFGEIELPGPGAGGAQPADPFADFGAPSNKGGFGEIDLGGDPLGTSPRAATGVGSTGVGASGVTPPSLAPPAGPPTGSSDFGELELPGPGMAAGMGASKAGESFGNDFGSVGFGEPSGAPLEAKADTRADGGMGFGEVDLGGGSAGAGEDDMEFGAIPQEKRGAADLPMGESAGYEATLPKTRERAEEAPEEEKKPGNGGRIAAVIFALLLVGGAALQFDDRLGAFGWKAISDKVNEGKYVATLDGAVKRTQAAFGEDALDRADDALKQLAGDVATAPRYAPIVGYSAYAQFAYEIRFGKDPSRDTLARSSLDKMKIDNAEKKLAEAARDVVAGTLPAARNTLKSVIAGDAKNVDAAVTLGELELRAKQPKDAVAAFDKAVKIRDDARTRGGLMRAYDAAGDAEKAKAEAQGLAAKSKTNATSRILLAHYAWEKDKDEKTATKWLDELEQPKAIAGMAVSERIDALTLRGMIDLDRGRVSKAKESFERAIKEAKGTPTAGPQYGMGEYFMANGQFPQAIAAFQQASQAAPDMTIAKIGIARALLKQEKGSDAKAVLMPLKDPTLAGEIGFWLGQAEEKISPDKPNDSMKIYENAIKAQPQEVKPYIALANLQAKTGRAEDADATIAQASKTVPPSERLHLGIGELRFRQERYKEALEHFDKALELQPSNLEAMFSKAKTLLRMGDKTKWEEGKKVLDQVSEKDSKYPGLSLEYGLYYQKTDKIEEALGKYKEALQAAPNDVDIQLQIARAQVEARMKDAEDRLREILGKCGTSPSPDICTTEAKHFLGRAILNRNAAAEAKPWLEQAVAKGDNNAQYHLYYGWALLDSGDLIGADKEIMRTLELDKSLGFAYWLRAEVELRSGKNPEAIQSAKQALAITPSLYQAHATIGQAFYSMGNEEPAVAEFSLAIKGDPKNPKAIYWRYAIANIRYHQDRTVLALTEIKDAIKAVEPLDAKPTFAPKLYFFLGEALRGSDRKGACEAYGTYLKQAVGTTDVAKKEAEAARKEVCR
ncbi:MAG: tetratricopeptide repeat protein [Polyangiales bacterium]